MLAGALDYAACCSQFRLAAASRDTYAFGCSSAVIEEEGSLVVDRLTWLACYRRLGCWTRQVGMVARDSFRVEAERSLPPATYACS